MKSTLTKYCNKIILILLCLITFYTHSQNKRKIDSLYTILKTATNDTAKINAHIQIAYQLIKGDTNSAFNELKKVRYKLNNISDDSFIFRSIERFGKICYKANCLNKSKYYYQLGIQKAKEKNEPEWISRFYQRIAEMLQYEDFSKQCIPYFDSALMVLEKSNNMNLASLYMLRGRAHYDNGDYKPAMDDYIVAQRIFEKNKLFNQDYGHLLHFIGSVFKRQDLFDKSLEYYEKELHLATQINNKYLEAEALYLCAEMYGLKGDSEKDLQYQFRALKLYKELGNSRSIAMMLGNISSNYADKKNYKKAIQYCEEALKIYTDINETDRESWLFEALGNYYSKLGQHKKALQYLNKSLEYAKKIETKQLLNQTEITQSIAFAYAGMGDFKSAFNKYIEYKLLNDSTSNLDNKMYLNDLETKYGTEKKEKEIALLNKDKKVQQTELDKKETQRNALIIGCVLVILIAGVSIVAFINNKKKSKLLSLQVREINYQNTIIKEKNKDITDSIVYAKRLQEAVLPSVSDLKKYFTDSFILFRPKDIVSGDFYWFEQVDDKIIFIVGDSTGHGVPGAFMSILGYNLLNQIILEEKIIQPAEILSLLDKRVTNALNKKTSKQEYNDGMDIGVCVIDKKKNKICYSGANRPLIIKRGSEIFDLKQNKFAIGGINTNNNKVFMQHEIESFKKDVLYLFSDGYYDQFGGPKGKKFKFKQMQELLLSHADKPMTDQLELLNNSFDSWKGNLEQIDDVCVIGIRIP